MSQTSDVLGLEPHACACDGQRCATLTTLRKMCVRRGVLSSFCSILSSIATLAAFRASPILCPLLLSQPEFSSLVTQERICAPNCSVPQRIVSSLRDVIFMIFW